MSTAPEFLSETQLAELLDIKRTTLSTWRSANIGPAFVRVSRNVIRYARTDVDDWLANQRVKTLESS